VLEEPPYSAVNPVPAHLEEMVRLVYGVPVDERSRAAAEEVAQDLRTLSGAELERTEGIAIPRGGAAGEGA
jgi:hypothetical protein